MLSNVLFWSSLLALPLNTLALAQKYNDQTNLPVGVTAVATSSTAGPQSSNPGSTGASTSSAAQFTVPASADVGANLIANIKDPDAVDAQSVCPGYTASNVVRNQLGFSATLSLAGAPCNVYGTDIDELSLTVEYQSAHRLSVSIVPSRVVSGLHHRL